MKPVISHRRLIAWAVLVAFFLLIQTGGYPSVSAKEAKAKQEMAGVSGSDESAAPGSVEKVGESKTAAKKKGFPWLLVAGGVVIAGAVLYFTVIKKPKYDLTVTVGQGVDGKPAAGTYTYKKGTTVSYNYTPITGYTTTKVKLDGSEVASSGTITMNSDHTLEVNAAEGLHDDFDTAASPLWAPYQPNEWSVGGGLYHCSANRAIPIPYNWNYNVCKYPISQTNYTVTVRQQRSVSTNVFAILLAAGTNMKSVSGYLFDFNTGISYWLGRYDNYDLIGRTGGDVTIQTWKDSTAIQAGLGAWNVVKITRSGSAYSLTINNTDVYSFNDSNVDPRYVVLLSLVDSNVQCDMNYDYVYIDVGNASAVATAPSMPQLFPSSVELDSTGRNTTRR